MNLNEFAWVRLTPVGLARLQAIREELSELCPGIVLKPRIRNGWYKDQLWSLFKDFGPMIQLGAASPFEGNEIRFTPPEEE